MPRRLIIFSIICHFRFDYFHLMIFLFAIFYFFDFFFHLISAFAMFSRYFFHLLPFYFAAMEAAYA